MPHVEQELHTLPKHTSSTLVFSGVRVAGSLVFCVVLCITIFFRSAILLLVLHRFTASDYCNSINSTLINTRVKYL